MATPSTVEEAARTVEEAAQAFLSAQTAEQRVTAERWLLEIRRWPQPLACCRHLLLHSTVGYAKMQALVMMRECLGVQWLLLSPIERSELQLLLLRLLTDAAVEPYVRAVAAQNLAVHAKHDILNASPAAASAGGGAAAPAAVALDALFHACTQMLEEASGAHAAAALELLIQVLGEFGAPSSGVVGGSLPWSMHARARAAFQSDHLLRVFHLGLQQLQRLGGCATPRPAPLTRALTLCASLLASVLSWDFGGVGEAAAAGDARPGLNASVVRPLSSEDGWRETLGRTELLAAVISLHGSAGAAGAEGVHELVHSLQQLLVMLASVSRRVFADDAAHAAYATLLLRFVAEELLATTAASGCERPMRGEGAFRDGSVALQRLIVCSGADALLALPADILEGLLRLLHTATLFSLQATLRADADDDDADAPIAESHDVLMEAWVSLVLGTGAASRAGGRRPPALEEAAHHVYEACVRAKLHATTEEAARCAEHEVDEGAEDADTDKERHAALAVLGRVRAAAAVTLLSGALAASTAKLQQYCELVATGGTAAAARAGVGASVIEAVHEELDCLVQCAGHLVADDPEAGETPEPPPELAAAAAHAAAAAGGGTDASSHPAAVLSSAVTSVLQLQLQAICSYDVSPAASPLASALSPVLGTTLLHFLRRFASCYLMPDEATCSCLSPALLALWGADTPGATALLTMCVESASVYLLRWPSESDVAAEACALLAMLGRLRAPRRGPAQMLHSLPSWQSLATVPTATLRPDAQCQLLEALSRAAAAIPDDAARDATLRALIAPMPQRLQALVTRVGGGGGGGATAAAATLQRPDVALEVRACCAGLRGIALSCARNTVAVTTEGLGPCLQLLVQMVPAYAPAAEPLAAILKAHRDLARTAAPLLPPPAAQAFAEHCAELVRTYAQHAPAPPPEATPPPPAAAQPSAAEELAEHQRYKQLKALLHLLTHLAAREEAPSDAHDGAYTRALSAAVGHLLPCISAQLLLYPKLTSAYFGLLGAWLEGRPLAAVSMPPPLYDSVHASLSFGLAHHSLAICRGALETTYELARRAAQHGASAAPMEGLLRQLLSRVAADLLTSRLHPDVVDPAAGNALLALVVAQPAHWQALAGSVVAAQPTPEAQQRAAALLGALLSSNGVTATLARPNRIRFRANLDTMLKAVTASNLVLPTGA